MKKMLTWLLVLALCLPLSTGALAAKQDEEAPSLDEFTFENAFRIIAYYGWEGITGSVSEVGVRFWRSKALQRVELTQEMIDASYLAAFASADCTLSVMLQDYGVDLEEYRGIIEDSGYENIRDESINGRDFVIYDEPQKNGALCRVAAAQEPEGRVLEFVFYYTGSSFDYVATLFDTTFATIGTLEETEE